MSIKEVLDKISELIRIIQYANQTKEQIAEQLSNILIVVGQALVQKETAHEELQKFATQLWISHVKGCMDCPQCRVSIPIEFFVGSKGVAGKPLAAASKDELIQKLEFPPISLDDLNTHPIPDYMPEL